jgi:hypothetical protein
MKYRNKHVECIGSNEAMPKSSSDQGTPGMTSIYLNRFMEPSYVVESLKEGIHNADIRKLVLDGVDMHNGPVRNALLELCSSCNHDWDEFELKSCLGPLHEVVTEIFFPFPPRGNPQGIDRIRTIHQMSITADLDHKLTLAVAEGLASTATRTCVRKLVLSGSKVLGVNMVALRHGLEQARKKIGAQQLEELSFTTSHLELEAVAELAVGLNGGHVHHQGLRHTGLRKLDLFSCNLSDESVAELVSTLQQGGHPIQELDLGKNKCGPAGLAAIGQMLSDPRTQLKWLNLFFQQSQDDGSHRSHNHPVEQPQPQQILDVSLFTNSLAVNQSLIALILRGNQLSDSGMHRLAQALQQNTVLKRLNLTDCHISHAAIRSFVSRVLPQSHETGYRGGIRKLWLDGSQSFGKDGNGSGGDLAGRREMLGWLKDALQSNVSLEELYLPFGYFEDRASSREISLILDLNRGGRRLMIFPHHGGHDGDERNLVPAALWPRVLERVGQFNLFMGLRHKHKNDEELRKAESRRANVMYSLLRGHVLLQSS